MIDQNEAGDKVVRAAAVIPVLHDSKSLQTEREEETRGLVEALDAECVFVSVINVRKPNSATLFGSGQLDAISVQLETSGCELLIVDGTLTPIQQRNLEKRVGCKVIDRTGLILEIFGLRARTKSGRLQVETARLAYERSRLVRTWTHLERQRGGQGVMSGPGETQIEADRRMIDAALLRLKKQLAEVERTRRLQRSNRESRDIPVVALVGYTNAGKSTLFNRLADSDVFVKDMPFATLDPTIRQVRLGKGKEIALIDTVGFITDLPTALIRSFQATLEESIEADLILHVHDASSPDAFQKAADIDEVLTELEEMFDRDLPPVVHVWNKSDLLGPNELEHLKHRILQAAAGETDAAVSSVTGLGIDELKQIIVSAAFDETISLNIELLPEEGDVQAWLYRHGRVISLTHVETTGNSQIQVDVSGKAFSQLNKQFPKLSARIGSSND